MRCRQPGTVAGHACIRLERILATDFGNVALENLVLDVQRLTRDSCVLVPDSLADMVDDMLHSARDSVKTHASK